MDDLSEASDPSTPTSRLDELWNQAKKAFVDTGERSLLEALATNPSLSDDALRYALFQLDDHVLAAALRNASLPLLAMTLGARWQERLDERIVDVLLDDARADRTFIPALKTFVAAHGISMGAHGPSLTNLSNQPSKGQQARFLTVWSYIARHYGGGTGGLVRGLATFHDAHASVAKGPLESSAHLAQQVWGT